LFNLTWLEHNLAAHSNELLAPEVQATLAIYHKNYRWWKYYIPDGSEFIFVVVRAQNEFYGIF